MNRIFSKTFIIAALIGMSNLQAQDISKRGTSSADFLKIGAGAKAKSMGSAFVAVADDISSIYWNPAGLSRLTGTHLMVDYTDLFADIKYNSVAFSYSTEEIGTFGFSYISSDIPDQEVTTEEYPDGNGQVFSSKQSVISIAYSLQLTDRFSIGFNPKVVYESYWKTTAYGFALDIGALYDTPFEGVTLGMSITNFGAKMRLQGTTTTILHDPYPSGSGNNPRIPGNLSTGEFDLPLNYKLGVSYKAYKDDLNYLILSSEVAHPSDNYESMNVGAEYIYGDFISLQAGYKSIFLEGSEEGLTLGGGIKYMVSNNLWSNFNYSYAEFGVLGYIQNITIGLNF